ncbi:TRAP transporter substrate-binding protein DctP [Salinarimonas soli]|uniref:C4-dicarboxylate ABC transporter n=1 Tax=Salinarimonas soli TaxID=1638099 RepID=A0A5B2VJ45_9HYPH|nr:TRAP transporter substrate-binding protein DctP [Salinarimonas soli]KAA2238217.1 C4-dicarboxylate ABC transporter [Salinarimonas soli]
MTPFRRLGLAALAIALTTTLAQAQSVMRLSHPVPTGHHIHKLLEGFAADVKGATNGAVEVQIFPAEQAAKANENHPSVARGGIEAASSTNFQWGNTIPEMNVTVIPYYFTDLKKIRNWFDSPAAKLLEAKLEQRGVKNIMWLYTTRSTVFTANKPLLKPDDFKGVKIRGLNRLADTALTAIGAAPSAMAAPEVYQALQSGVLDAALTDVSAGVSRRFFEVQKFGTVTPYFMVWYHVYVNPAWWNKLSPEHREAVQKAARKTELAAFDLTEATAAAAVDELKKRGMNLHVNSAADDETWKKSMQKPVLDEFLKAAPSDGQKLLDAIDKL